jgi:hypothetical protein
MVAKECSIWRFSWLTRCSGLLRRVKVKNCNFIEKDLDDGLVGGTLEEDWGLMAIAQLKSEILQDSVGD